MLFAEQAAVPAWRCPASLALGKMPEGVTGQAMAAGSLLSTYSRCHPQTVTLSPNSISEWPDIAFLPCTNWMPVPKLLLGKAGSLFHPWVVGLPSFFLKIKVSHTCKLWCHRYVYSSVDDHKGCIPVSPHPRTSHRPLPAPQKSSLSRPLPISPLPSSSSSCCRGFSHRSLVSSVFELHVDRSM